MKKIKKTMLIILISIALLWVMLTLFVELPGPERITGFGNKASIKKAIIIYNPDPFYNLDQQVCEAFAKGLAANGWFVQVMSVTAAKKSDVPKSMLHVFCANTYNWAPDWPVTSFIKKHADIKQKKVAAIVVGAGSTNESLNKFKTVINEQGGILLDAKTWWLWRPNDKSRLKESNVKVAVEMAEKFGGEIAAKMETSE